MLNMKTANNGLLAQFKPDNLKRVARNLALPVAVVGNAEFHQVTSVDFESKSDIASICRARFLIGNGEVDPTLVSTTTSTIRIQFPPRPFKTTQVSLSVRPKIPSRTVPTTHLSVASG